MKTPGQLMAERRPKPLFTHEEYQEILRARARLAKGMVKSYGYPECPSKALPLEQPELPEKIMPQSLAKIHERLDQVQGISNHLLNKITEMEAKSSKKRKFISYEK